MRCRVLDRDGFKHELHYATQSSNNGKFNKKKVSKEKKEKEKRKALA